MKDETNESERCIGSGARESAVPELAQEKFTTLVRTHSGWVYAMARRQLGDPGLAEDAAQMVFLALSHNSINLFTQTIGDFSTRTFAVGAITRHGRLAVPIPANNPRMTRFTTSPGLADQEYTVETISVAARDVKRYVWTGVSPPKRDFRKRNPLIALRLMRFRAVFCRQFVPM